MTSTMTLPKVSTAWPFVADRLPADIPRRDEGTIMRTARSGDRVAVVFHAAPKFGVTLPRDGGRRRAAVVARQYRENAHQRVLWVGTHRDDDTIVHTYVVTDR